MSVYSLGPLVARFIEKLCVHGPGDVLGKPVTLTDDEKDFLNRAYRLRDDGVRQVRRAVLGRPKGSRKTELAAWIALAELAGPVRTAGLDDRGRPKPTVQRDPHVVLFANSREQAGLAYTAVQQIVTNGPLSEVLEARQQDVRFLDRTVPGKLTRVAAEASTADGLRPTFVVSDESHEMTNTRKRPHEVIYNGLAKRSGAWGLDITTAGSPWDDSVARDLYERGGLLEAHPDPTWVYDWREPPLELVEKVAEGDRDALEEATRMVNPEPWKDLGAILSRFDEVPLSSYMRYHLNVWWQDAAETFLRPGAWDDRAAPDRNVADGERVWLGFDGSATNDSTAIVGATDDGHLWLVGVWERPPEAWDWHVPRLEVDAAVAQAFDRWDVQAMWCDPYLWQDEIGRWAEQFGEDRVLSSPTNHQSRHAPLVGRLWKDVHDDQATLTHDGSEVLRRHFANAVASETRYGPTISKRDQHAKIDAAVSAILAWGARAAHVDNGVLSSIY